MAHIYLVSDTRERHVHGFIETLFSQAGAGHLVSQINTGDYLICRRLAGGQPEILACIERKTLKDFAASFKDGRYLNRNKMMDLRDKTGCQLYFFVEGPAFPKPTWKISRIPYGSILSAMTNMMIRDGIHVVQTENEMGTAQRLLDFVHAFEKTDIPYRYPLAAPALQKAEDEAVEGGDADVVNVDINSRAVPDLVMGTIEKDDSILVTEVWAKLTGISLPTAQVVSTSFSVADLVGGRVSDNDLADLRTAGGRQLVKRGKASLAALKRGAQKEEIKVLSGVPGISPAIATQLLTTGGPGEKPIKLSAFLALGQAGIAAVTIRQKGRTVRLGDARAERVFRLLNYRAGEEEPPDAADEPEPYQVPPAAELDDDELDDLLGV